MRPVPFFGLMGLLYLAVAAVALNPSIERSGSRWTEAAVTETYTVRWTGDGLGPIDTLRFVVTATDRVAQSFAVVSPTFPRAFPITWTSPAPGDSILTQGCATVVRRRLAVTACSATRTYRTADQPPPPPVVDTTVTGLLLTPETVAVQPGDSVQFCAWVAFQDGAVAVRASDPPACHTRYQAAGLPAPDTSQQRIADGRCLQWSATGGTIAAELC